MGERTMTLGELAEFCNKALGNGVDPDSPVQVRSNGGRGEPVPAQGVGGVNHADGRLNFISIDEIDGEALARRRQGAGEVKQEAATAGKSAGDGEEKGSKK